MAERGRNEEVVALTSRVEEGKRESLRRLCEVEEAHQRSGGYRPLRGQRARGHL